MRRTARDKKRDKKKEKFTALLHHVSVEALEEAFGELRPEAAADVDGLTWEDHAKDLERALADLHGRVHRGAYRAQPNRRVFIP